MNSLRSKSLSILCLLTITGTATNSYADGIADITGWFTTKRIASLAVVAAVGRLVTKDVNGVERTFTDELNKLRSKPLSTAWFQQVWSVFDDYVIGYPGKGRGLKVAGSTVVVEGQEAALGSFLKEGDLKLDLYGYKRVDASGILGTTWSYLQDIVKGLKFVKEVDDIGTSFGIIDGRLFSTK
jgi:hypothetical protein